MYGIFHVYFLPTFKQKIPLQYLEAPKLEESLPFFAKKHLAHQEEDDRPPWSFDSWNLDQMSVVEPCWTNPFLSNNSHGSYRYQYRFRRVSKHHETAAYRRGHQKQGIKLLPVRLHGISLGSYHWGENVNFSTQKNSTKWITATPVSGWKDIFETTN